MVLKTQVEIIVPFHDVDILHVAWHGHYMKYFEVARTALMQKIDLDWPKLKSLGVAMPVVELHVNYRRPLLYNARIIAEASIHEREFPELKIHYELRDSLEESVLATGWTRQIYFDVEQQQTLFSIPEVIVQQFEAGET